MDTTGYIKIDGQRIYLHISGGIARLQKDSYSEQCQDCGHDIMESQVNANESFIKCECGTRYAVEKDDTQD